MASRIHTATITDTLGAPLAVTGVTLYVVRDSDSVEVLGTSLAPIAATETGIGTGVWQVASGNIYSQGESYSEYWLVTLVSGATQAFVLNFEIGVSGSLTSVANVKAYLGITAATDDALIATLITRAQDRIERHCNRIFNAATFTEDIDGGGRSLVVRNGPIQTLTSVSYVGGTSVVDIDLDKFTVNARAGVISLRQEEFCPFFERRSRMRSPNHVTFTAGIRNYRVVYDGGFTVIPADLEQACIELVKSAYINRRINGDIQGESVGGGAQLTARSAEDAFQRIAYMLEPFRRPYL